MRSSKLARTLFGALAVVLIALSPACGKKKSEDPQIRDLTQKTQELGGLTQQANVAGAEQNRKLREAGVAVNDVKPNAETMQLTDDQKKFLEERIKAEKNSTYQALLQEVLDKDKEIATLNKKIAGLRSILPKPDVAKANDSHYGLAMHFLRKRGVSEEKAKALIGRVLIMDKLAPGFEVFHFYTNGIYGTAVTQGKALVSPTELQAEEKAKITGERDTAQAQSAELREELADLTAQKVQITSELEGLHQEKERLVKDMAALASTNEAQLAKLNSVHFVVADRKKLEADKVIVVPVFAKDRAGANWADSVFTRSLDLRTQDVITITAAEVGHPIKKVTVIPGSLERDKQYTVTVSEDRTSATIKLLVKARFKNEKVVFAVE
jgi:hypothetical protein